MEIAWGRFIVFGQLTRDGIFRYIRRELVWGKEKEKVEEGLKRNKGSQMFGRTSSTLFPCTHLQYSSLHIYLKYMRSQCC